MAVESPMLEGVDPPLSAPCPKSPPMPKSPLDMIATSHSYPGRERTRRTGKAVCKVYAGRCPSRRVIVARSHTYMIPLAMFERPRKGGHTFTQRSIPPLISQPGPSFSCVPVFPVAIGTDGRMSSKNPPPDPPYQLEVAGGFVEANVAGTAEDGNTQSRSRTGPECATGMRSS